MDDGRSVPIPGFLFLCLCRNLFGRLRIPVAFRRTVPGASLFVRPEFSGPPFRSSRVLPVFSFNPIGRFHFPENSVDWGFQAVAPR